MPVDKESFNTIKKSLLHMDPVWFCENYLVLEGQPFRLTNNGFKPFADIYRYIGIKALEPGSKPVVFVKGRQVGGTTMAGALECFFMGCGMFGHSNRPPMRIIHTFPILEQSSGYSKSKLSSLISSSITAPGQEKKNDKKSYMQSLIDSSHESSNSLSFKQFVGGNQLWIDATGADGDRLRGKTADLIFIDEFQDTPSEAVNNMLNMLKQAKYGEPGKGVRVFFGTPKKKGSDFYKLWAASSQQFYHLGCAECKLFFPLYTPGSDDWEKIWIHGFIVKCPHCGFEQDKRDAAERGKWVPTADPNGKDYVGFHINQLYMPHITKESVMSEKPGIHPTNTERAYQNEVLGEFYQGDSSPITVEEIEEHCADKGRKMRNRIGLEENLKVFLGIDYGARADLEQMADTKKNKVQQGQSYTTAVVLAARGPKLFSVEFALKFKRNDLESKKGLIDKLMRDYSVNLCIGDIGFSQDFSTMMHTAYGDRYLVSRAHSKVNDKVKYTEDAYPKEIVFERDHFIGEMFELLKGGNVKFPYGDFDKIGWLIQHCASMDIKPSISRFGDPSIHYVKGSEPNDGLMALLNAYIAYKFYVTNGFKVKNPLIIEQNMKAKKQPLAITGFIKRKM